MEHFQDPHNVGEIKDADGVGTVGNPTCLTPKNLIITNPGVEAIKDLGVGDKVLGHDGKYHVINKVFSRQYTGNVYRLRVHNLGEFELTDEHHIFAKKLSSFPHKHKASSRVVADWYSPIELSIGDVVLYPISLENQGRKHVKLNQEKPKFDYKSFDLPNVIKLEKDFLKIIGFYLSEGYVRVDACKGTVGFCFGKGEEEFERYIVDKFDEIFQLAPGIIRRENNSIHIPFYSARLARFFAKNFGKGAAEKQLPDWVIKLSPRQQKHIIYGLWHGDGYLNEKKSVAKFVTISRVLAFQTRQLLFRQKIDCSFLTSAAYGIHKKHYSIYVKKQESLKRLADILDLPFQLKSLSKSPKKNWFEDGYYCSPIWKITKRPYKGKVYNLEVEESHSYTTEAASVHNCGDVMKLYLKIEDGIIKDAKFKTFGCGAAIATSSMVTDMVKGKTIEEAQKISNKAVAEALEGLPPIKMHCSVLAEDALKAAIDDYLKKSKQPQNNKDNAG
ncbi:MAG: hypothetical protein C4562_03350 [Actinobacteria bacterium]|nr:MAG: hypothetical protein C4562_03350 [Actinomycetota bacterium]